MAIDDALLDRAAAGTASLRFYEWSTPTVSLGYFQPQADRLILPHLPWLRRATGGELILHGDGDITYALALPADKHWHDGEPWLCRMHHLLQKVFRKFDVQAKTVVCGEEQRLGPAHCFLHHTAGDLILNTVKIAGSAQRRHRGALLQHGTIRLRTSKHVPQFTGALNGEVSNDRFMDEVKQEFESQTKWKLQTASLNAQLESCIDKYCLQRYHNPEWNCKR